MQCLFNYVCHVWGKVSVPRGSKWLGRGEQGGGRRRGQKTKGTKGWVTRDPLGHCKSLVFRCGVGEDLLFMHCLICLESSYLYFVVYTCSHCLHAGLFLNTCWLLISRYKFLQSFSKTSDLCTYLPECLCT